MIFLYICIIKFCLFIFCCGLRGNAPMISLGGNSLSMNEHELLLILDIRIYDDMIFDVRLWGCDGHFEYIGILWWNRLYMVSYPRVWFGDLQTVKGGGGSGIGGIKWTTGKHEFCIVRSLKICTNLGCKWGVPLVIGGGGGVNLRVLGFRVTLGCHL